MSLQRAFDCASERVEHVLSTWQGCTGYVALCALCGLLWGWNGLDRWVYLSGAVIIILLIGAGRRDSKAAHAQLEALLDGDDLKRLEDRSEAEIEELRG